MVEKGILVKDADSGESIACRDAVETDEFLNSRIIQRIDVVKGKLPSPFRAATNLLRSGVNDDYNLEQDWEADGVYDNLITVGDKSTLVVQVEAKDLTTATVLIAPIALEDDGSTLQGILDTKEVSFNDTTARVKLNAGGYDNFYITPFLTWDVYGARKIAILVMSNSDGYVSLDIYGAVI